jgi:serine/threonine protein kinase
MTETRLTAVSPTSYYPDLAGVVVGNYRLISEISSGGMGTVYRAKHEIIGRPAAVKVLRPDLTSNQELIDRFFTEAKAATAIRHPGIVEVYDFGYMADGSAYLVMELLEGKPLGRRLAEVERFSEWEAANIARGIASALKAAHSQGIVHRDLKPDNVFLIPDLEGATGSVRPKVLDFGIAKLTERAPGDAQHTQMGALIGTPLYMAPEQARSASAIDQRADLYSLGCILYELLTGRPPLVAEGAGEIVAMHLFTPPEPPTTLVRDISPEMNALVMRLLEKEPVDRYQTAGELATALSQIGARLSTEYSIMASGPRPVHRHVPTTMRDQPPTQQAPAPARGRSLPIIVGALTATIAIGLIVFLLVRGSGSDTEPTPETPKVIIEAKPPVVPAPQSVPAPPVELKPAPKPKPVRPVPQHIIKPVPETAPVETKIVPKPRGPTTPEGSPIETQLDSPKKPKPQ